jgi:hypothetical protein
VPRLTHARLVAVGRDPAFSEPDRGGRLPGIGARFIAGVLAEATTEGWRETELSGLAAAAEERSLLWLLTPATRPWRTPEIRRWQARRFVPSDQDLRSLVLTAAAACDRSVCLVGVSGGGRGADSISAKLAAVGARVGRVESGVADALQVRWAVELMVAPLLTNDALRALRDVMASAPRCGWCGVPVLGNRCLRCAREST